MFLMLYIPLLFIFLLYIKKIGNIGNNKEQSLATAELFEFPKIVYDSPKWKPRQQVALFPVFPEGNVF